MTNFCRQGCRLIACLPMIVMLSVPLFGAGCASTHRVGVTYKAPSAKAPPAKDPIVRVGPFRDNRGVDSDWLGAIRGGYGNVLKRLRTEGPVNVVVEEAFREALRERGLLSEHSEAMFELQGSIKKFDCSYYFNREAHAHLDVSLVRVGDGREVLANSYAADNSEAGIGAGIFGSVETLRLLAERTLSDAISRVLDDPHFHTALEMREAPQTESTYKLSDRLQELEALKEQGLVTDEEYERKRSELLDSL